METKVENICNSINEQKQDIKTIIEKLDKLDNKFAGKWVEKVTMGVATGVIGGLIILIIQVI